jgi:hydroxymethylpyrimidine/phosphomethylpyrimidine kinase
MSVITAVTAQNTVGVHAVQKVPLHMMRKQIEAVFSDLGAGAVKSGMIPGAPAMRVVAEGLRQFQVTQYVLDPVMVATTGASLMDRGAVRTLCRRLMPLALLVTPNRYEAEILAGCSIHTRRQMEDAARRIFDLGPQHVLIKGGHFKGTAADLLFDGRRFRIYSAPRVSTRNLHGAGCTLAAAITAFLARGLPLLAAVARAKRYVSLAVAHSFSVGHGPGPLGHFFRLWLK